MTTIPADLQTPLRSSKGNSYLWRAFRRLRPYWRLAALAYLALLASTVIILATPQFIRWIVDRGIRQNDLQMLTWSVLLLLGLTVARGVFTFFSGRWTEVASQGVSYDFRHDLHAKLTELSFAYHDRTESGQLLSRAMQDVERLRFLTGRSFLGLANGVILLVGTAVALVVMNPTLALLALLTVPVLAHRAMRFGVHYRPLSQEIQQQLAVLTTRLEQNLRGARIVKAFAQEDAEIERFDTENRKWFGLAEATARLTAVNMPMLDLIANLATVIIIWYGGLQVIRGGLTLGELVAFITYLAQLAAPIRRLGFIIPSIAMASASAERVFEILDEETQVAEAADAEPLPPLPGPSALRKRLLQLCPTPQCAARRLSRYPAGPSARAARADRFGQIIDHQHDPAFLRPDRGTHPARRPRCPRRDPAFITQSDRHRAAGVDTIRHDDSREHRLRQARRL